jgi:hypothetical protein
LVWKKIWIKEEKNIDFGNEKIGDEDSNEHDGEDEELHLFMNFLNFFNKNIF